MLCSACNPSRIFVWQIQIYCRRNDIFVQSQQRRADSSRAACALRMPDLRFCCRHRNFISVFTKSVFDGLRFDAVVQLRRSSVQINVINFCPAKFLHRPRQSASRAPVQRRFLPVERGDKRRTSSRNRQFRRKFSRFYFPRFPEFPERKSTRLRRERFPNDFLKTDAMHVAARSFQSFVRTVIKLKPSKIPRAIGASTPPVSIKFCLPSAMCCAA